KLDRERQAVQEADEARDRRGIFGIGLESRFCDARTLRKQLDRLVGRKRSQCENSFAGQPQHFSRGHEESRVARAAQPSTERGLGVARDLLEVVENDQAMPARRDGKTELRYGVVLAERYVEAMR